MKKEISNEIVADLFKIYNSAIDAYNALILKTINRDRKSTRLNSSHRLMNS